MFAQYARVKGDLKMLYSFYIMAPTIQDAWVLSNSTHKIGDVTSSGVPVSIAGHYTYLPSRFENVKAFISETITIVVHDDYIRSMFEYRTLS
jgi:hypothetical protein